MKQKNDLSPADIRHKEFKISIVGGYDKNEVDEYLAILADQFEQVYTANVLQNSMNTTSTNGESVVHAQQTIEQMQKREELIANTLLYAQNMRDEVIKIAQSEAKNIIDAAEITAKKTYDETNFYLNSLRQEFINVKESHRQFLITSHAHLKVMLERLEQDPIFKKENELEVNNAFEEARTMAPVKKKVIKTT